MEYLTLEKVIKENERKICVFGAGKIGKTWAYDILTCVGFEINCYCDNKISAGTEIRDGIKTISFNDLCNEKNYLVFIAVNEKIQDEIKQQFEENGITNYIMMGFLFFKEFCESVLYSKNEAVWERYKIIVDDKEFLKRQLQHSVGYELDIDNPKTFNKKLQWLKFHDRNPQYTKLVDK